MSFPALLAFVQDTTAPATGAPAPAGGLSDLFGGMLVPLALCMLVFYFFMIAPERKARKKREQMLSSLEKGAKVMTTGGLYGIVSQVQDQIVTLQVADGVRMRFALSSIQMVLEDDKSRDREQEKAAKES